MDLQTQLIGPSLDVCHLGLQRLQCDGGQCRVVAEPDVQIAAGGMGHTADAAHQIEPLDVIPAPSPFLVFEAATQLLGCPQYRLVRGVARDPGGCRSIDKPGQHRVVDMKQQRQQIDEYPLARPQFPFDPAQSLPLNTHKPAPDLLQIFAADTIPVIYRFRRPVTRSRVPAQFQVAAMVVLIGLFPLRSLAARSIRTRGSSPLCH